MKKALFSIYTNLSAFFAYLFVAPKLAFAQTTVDPCPPAFSQFRLLCDPNLLNFGRVVGNLITIAFVIAVVIALGFLVYGGIKWITSGGDKTAVEGARNTIVAAIVGLVVVFLSYFILNIILGLFGLTLGGLTIPKLTQ